MNFITVARLQREFGLPIMRASNIISEQRALAFRRHLPLAVVGWCCLLVVAGSSILDFHLPKGVTSSLWLAALVLILLRTLVAHRVSQEPILAAARAWRSRTADDAQG
jgi:hypothetical protein